MHAFAGVQACSVPIPPLSREAFDVCHRSPTHLHSHPLPPTHTRLPAEVFYPLRAMYCTWDVFDSPLHLRDPVHRPPPLFLSPAEDRTVPSTENLVSFVLWGAVLLGGRAPGVFRASEAGLLPWAERGSWEGAQAVLVLLLHIWAANASHEAMSSLSPPLAARAVSALLQRAPRARPHALGAYVGAPEALPPPHCTALHCTPYPPRSFYCQRPRPAAV